MFAGPCTSEKKTCTGEWSLPSFFLVAGGSHWSLTFCGYSCITPNCLCHHIEFSLCVSICISAFRSYKDTSLIRLEPTLIHYDLILTWLQKYIKMLAQIRSCSEVLGGHEWGLGGTIQPSTIQVVKWKLDWISGDHSSNFSGANPFPLASLLWN